MNIILTGASQPIHACLSVADKLTSLRALLQPQAPAEPQAVKSCGSCCRTLPSATSRSSRARPSCRPTSRRRCPTTTPPSSPSSSTATSARTRPSCCRAQASRTPVPSSGRSASRPATSTRTGTSRSRTTTRWRCACSTSLARLGLRVRLTDSLPSPLLEPQAAEAFETLDKPPRFLFLSGLGATHEYVSACSSRPRGRLADASNPSLLQRAKPPALCPHQGPHREAPDGAARRPGLPLPPAVHLARRAPAVREG